MKNIVLMCAGGMSTSIIMKNIKKAADAEGLECEVSAHAVNEAATIGRNADCILVMKDGYILEQGTHEDLLARGGFYAELYNSQFAGKET